MNRFANRLRVVAVPRSDAQRAPGGGEIQMTSTVAALRDLGVDATVWHPGEGELARADCVHLFGSRPEHLPVVEAARRRGAPVVLSTIAWFDWADYWRGGSGLVGRAAAAARFAARAACPRLPSWRRRLYHSVDLLLPNSAAEAEQLSRYFGVPAERIRVVPNGADPRFGRCDPGAFVERFGVEGFVLCPGRIEPRKNQLGLIRAMRGIDTPLVILGRVVPGHEDYFEICRREAAGNVRFLDRLDHDDPLLGSAYAACGCLALASWFETPGLVALEAALSGTPLVLPDGGCAAEYFGSHARYVRPGDVAGIRRAVLGALAAGRSRALAEHVRERFSWDAAAKATLDGYAAARGHAEGDRRPADEVRWRQRPLGRYRYVRLRWRVLFNVVDFVGAKVFEVIGAAGRWMRPKHVHASADMTPNMAPEMAAGFKTDPRSILIIQLDHLGDAVLSTGMIGVLRGRYPRASIEVLAGRWNRDLFAAIDAVDRVHVSRLNRFSRGGRFGWPLAVLWWAWRLRRRRFDLGIDVRGEFPLALLLWLCGARRRLGWAAGGGGFLLTDSPAFVLHRAETESRSALLAELGISVERPEELWPVFHAPEPIRRKIRRRLARRRVARCFVAVHVGAGTPAKQWPVEHWRTFIGRLVVEHGIDVVLVGGRADRDMAQAILGEKPWPGVHDWTGRTRVVELAALVAESAVAVGADSGPIHLAAAVGRPVVVLASGTNHHRQWQPPGPRVRVLHYPVACSPCHRRQCPRADHACMNRLLPEVVVAAVVKGLDETSPGVAVKPARCFSTDKSKIES
ncbi:MAG: glycosyltransferase [Pirellulales bacterium]|nr:glycosyltransferase [Pirellulales bacterium]